MKSTVGGPQCHYELGTVEARRTRQKRFSRIGGAVLSGVSEIEFSSFCRWPCGFLRVFGTRVVVSVGCHNAGFRHSGGVDNSTVTDDNTRTSARTDGNDRLGGRHDVRRDLRSGGPLVGNESMVRAGIRGSRPGCGRAGVVGPTDRRVRLLGQEDDHAKLRTGIDRRVIAVAPGTCARRGHNNRIARVSKTDGGDR